MSVDMNEEMANLADFEEIPMVKHFLKILNPSGFFFLTFLIPGLGNILDAINMPIWAPDSIKYFGTFTRAIIEGRKGVQGRAKDFISIFMETRISDIDANSATKVQTNKQ